MSRKKKESSATTKLKIPKELAELLQLEQAKDEKNRKKNKPMVFVAYVMVLVFMAMFGYIIYFMVHDAERTISNTANKRQDTMSEYVTRGDIVTSDGVIVAETRTEDGGEVRYYPYGGLFSHAVGYNSYGRSGLELEQNFNLLSSHVNIFKKFGNEIGGKKNPGDTIVTSLRFDLQQEAYAALQGARGAVVVLEPSTGRILAMVSSPVFDPNDIDSVWQSIHTDEGSESTIMLNRVTQGLYAPGSTFKIITALEYMRENPDYDDYSYYCSGNGVFNNIGIRCSGSRPHGEVDVEKSFAYSCNTSFSNMGTSLDMDKLKNLSEELLFNKTLPYDGAASQSSFKLDSSSDAVEIPQTVIGQGETLISPLHNALIMSAIANGGVLMKLSMVDRIENADGAIIREYSSKTVGTILPAEDIRRIRPLLEAVCDYGTASGYFSGMSYKTAGKTGTAEVDNNGRTNSWFAGFAGESLDNPDVVICAVVEDYSSNGISASGVARRVLDVYFSGN